MHQRRRLWNVGLAVLVCAAFFVLLMRTIPDPDLWGHLRFGLDIVESGKISSMDPYSYLTTGQLWINHEWLSEVSFALGWLAGGSAGLIMLKILIGGLTFGMIYAHLTWLRIHPLRAAMLLLYYSITVLPFLEVIRPQMFTYLFFGGFLIIIYRAEHEEYRWLWGLPLLAALWVNFHGGFLAGFAILAPWLVLHLMVHRGGWRRVIPPVLLALLALNINPYGFHLLTFLVRTATIPRPEISDWQPIKLLSEDGLLWCLMTIPAAAGIIYSSRPKPMPLLAILGVIALTPWFAVRNLPLYGMGVLIIAGEHIESAWERVLPLRRQEINFPSPIAVAPFFLAALLLGFALLMDFQHINVKKEDYPLGAIALLEESGVSGNLAIHFNWGEYAIWHLGPQVKVSMDGRRETVYAKKFYDENLNFIRGLGQWNAIIDDYPTDMALVSKDFPVYNLLKLDTEWMPIYSDSLSALFVRRGSAAAEVLSRTAATFTPPGPARYFP